MKKLFPIWCIVLIALLLSVRSLAQEEATVRAVPQWLSEKGYWEVESNSKTPDNFTVYFFTNEGTMVYKETVTGMKLDIKKRKTLMRLKRVLDESVVAWENHHLVRENGMLVAAAFKRSGEGH